MRIPIAVFPTPGGAADGSELLLPYAVGPAADAARSSVAHTGLVHGNGFSAAWCAHPACASGLPDRLVLR